MITAVLFDLGETLIHFNHVNVKRVFADGARASYDYLASLGLSLPRYSYYHKYQLYAVRWCYFVSRVTGREFNSRDLLARVSKRLGIIVGDQELDELTWRWYEPLANQSRLEPDVHKVLEQLRQSGLKLAIVSNTFVPGKTLDRHLVREGLLDLFPVRIYSCEVGVGKPRKEIFQIALKALQVCPQESLFVGDKYKVDICGAQRVGMYTVLKNSQPPKKKLNSRSIHIKHLTELPQVVKRLNLESQKRFDK